MELCPYCGNKPDGAMLVMGNSMAHVTCVIRKLNELLDPDYDSEGEPNKTVGFLPVYEPIQLEPLTNQIAQAIRLGICAYLSPDRYGKPEGYIKIAKQILKLIEEVTDGIERKDSTRITFIQEKELT